MATLWVIASITSFAVMLIHMTAMFDHFEETFDFAVFFQAGHQIANGDLNPYSTVTLWNYPHFGIPFVSSHFELLMWPISILLALFPSGYVLLVVGALGVAATQLLVAVWASRIVLERSDSPTALVALGLGITIFDFLNPWWYWAAFYSWHLELISLPLVVTAAYAYFYGHRRWAFALAALVAISGAVQASYLIGLSLGLFLLDHRRNRSALWIGLMGVVVFVFASAANLNVTSAFAVNYGYLAEPGATASFGSVALGVIRHPSAAIHMLVHRVPNVVALCRSAGLAGLLNPLGLCTAVVVLVGPWLAQTTTFLQPFASFQTVALQPFLVVGAALTTGAVLRVRKRHAIVAGWMAILVLCAILSVLWSKENMAGAFTFNTVVNDKTAVELTTVLDRIPVQAEVVAPNGEVGRFAGRRYVYPILGTAYLAFPVWEPTTYVVIPPNREGFEGVPPAFYQALTSRLERAGPPGLRVVYATRELVVFRYTTGHLGGTLDLAG
ncbi:MAG: DUF2079 domain-containing protein [Acidimicrobiales bacterium]